MFPSHRLRAEPNCYGVSPRTFLDVCFFFSFPVDFSDCDEPVGVRVQSRLPGPKLKTQTRQSSSCQRLVFFCAAPDQVHLLFFLLRDLLFLCFYVCLGVCVCAVWVCVIIFVAPVHCLRPPAHWTMAGAVGFVVHPTFFLCQ